MGCVLVAIAGFVVGALVAAVAVANWMNPFRNL